MKRLQEISNFYNLMKETDAIYETIQKQSGLSAAEFWCLAAIRLDGCLYQHEISDLYHINRQTVNAALRHLVQKGRLTLSAPPENQRIKTIALTPSGLSFVKKYIDIMAKLENAAWKKLPKEERDALYISTAHYNQRLKEETNKAFADL